MSEPHGSMHSKRIPLTRMYEYRRMLPHYQKANRAIFVTFCKSSREPFASEARDEVLQCCLKATAQSSASTQLSSCLTMFISF